MIRKSGIWEIRAYFLVSVISVISFDFAQDGVCGYRKMRNKANITAFVGKSEMASSKPERKAFAKQSQSAGLSPGVLSGAEGFDIN